MLPISDEKLIFRLFQRDGHQPRLPHRVHGHCPYAASMRRQQRACPWCIAQDVREEIIAATLRVNARLERNGLERFKRDPYRFTPSAAPRSILGKIIV